MNPEPVRIVAFSSDYGVLFSKSNRFVKISKQRYPFLSYQRFIVSLVFTSTNLQPHSQVLIFFLLFLLISLRLYPYIRLIRRLFPSFPSFLTAPSTLFLFASSSSSSSSLTSLPKQAYSISECTDDCTHTHPSSVGQRHTILHPQYFQVCFPGSLSLCLFLLFRPK